MKKKREKQRKSNTIKNFAPCLKGYVVPTVLTPVFIICEVMLEVIIPLLMATIVDGGLYREDDFMLKEFFPPELISNNIKFVTVLGCLMIVAALVSLTFGILAARTSAVSSVGFAKNLRKEMFSRIQSFSFKNTDRFSTSSLIMRATTDVNNVQNTFQQAIRMLVRAPIMIVLASIMAVNINLELSLIFLVALPILAISLYLLIRTGYPRFGAMLKKYDRMNRDVQENLIASRVVKSFVREEYEKKKFAESAKELQKAQVFAQKMFSFSNPIQLGIMWTCTILILFIGGGKVFGGILNAGELVSVMTYSTQIVSSLTMVSFLMMMIAMTRASVVRINEVFEEEPDITDAVKIGDGEPKKVADGSVDFVNVCFSYSGDEENLTLKNIDLHIKSGETIGIVGGTGEGKSTLVQLIPRFYDCFSGEVRVGGVNVKDYSLFELRESVSMVLQKNMLFTGTIADNLRWGDQNATDEQLVEACKLSCAHDFIESFPDGYQTVLGQGGVNVSGGQKQRLCIARALLKNPKVLIFDDSTSAVDTATDEKIRTSLRDSFSGVTKFIIAQRVASIVNADRIIVMDEGKISDVGTNDELLKRSEIYREIYESQMKEANE